MSEVMPWYARSVREKTAVPCGDSSVLAGRGPSQMGWYTWAAALVRGRTVLDVGCGSGEGLKVLSSTASYALGIDLDPRLQRNDVNVSIKRIEDIPDKSFDVVVCFDVIEHIDDDRAFIRELFRVARSTVLVSTPNYAMSLNQHPYHVREYLPHEFRGLLRDYGDVRLFAGTSKGREIVELGSPRRYMLVAALYAWRPTLFLAKVLKRVLGVRMWAHQTAVVSVTPGGAPEPAAPV